jgi:hypothetical protein
MRPLKRSSVASLLAVPVALYGTVQLAVDLRPLDPIAVVGIVLAALPLLAPGLGKRGGYLWIAPGLGPIVGVLLSAGSGFAPGSAGSELLGGLLMGSPVAIAAALFGGDRGPIVRLLLVTEMLVDLLGLFAGMAALGAGTVAATSGAVPVAFAQALAAQWRGLLDAATGASSFSLPLQALPGVAFTALAVIAWAGVLLGFLVDDASEFEEGWTDPARSAVGFGPIVAGAAAALFFELAAARSPRYALLGLGLAVIASLIAVGLVARRAAAHPEGTHDHG